jgi:hypothetical protein
VCIPYEPEVGLFINAPPIWPSANSDPWSFHRDGNDYILSHNGTPVDEFSGPSDGSVGWRFFGGGNFLAVQHNTSSASHITYRIWIYDLRNGPDEVSRYELSQGPYAGHDTSLVFHPSQDGTAFFIYIRHPDGQTNTHRVFRTATGTSLCSYGTLSPSGTPPGNRHAEITADRIIRIYTEGLGGGEITSWVLPEANLATWNNPHDYPETVVGDSSTANITLHNVGTDCLRIEAIDDDPPFSVSSPAALFPLDLDPGESAQIEVTFAPTEPGSHAGDLAMTVTPDRAFGERVLRCRGDARIPIVTIGFNAQQFNFGRQPVNQTTPTRTLTISNNGDADLTVTVAPPAATPFQWNSFTNRVIPVGGSEEVDITFTPTQEGQVSTSIQVDSNAPGSPHFISLVGEGCIPIGVPWSEASTPDLFDFGAIQRGLRAVRYITVRNLGDGPLTVRARIEGSASTDSAPELFGLLASEGDSILDVQPTRQYQINPEIPCGPLEAGTGERLVVVSFFANADPGQATARLILEDEAGVEFNAYPLSARIIPPVPFDFALVFDRSGSMTEEIESGHTKIEAARTAGRLFTDLTRPVAGDRLTVVTFNVFPSVVWEIAEITEEDKIEIGQIFAGNDPDLEADFEPTGFTSVAGGVITGRDQLAIPRATPPPVPAGQAIVLLTDGKENRAYEDSTGRMWGIVGGTLPAPFAVYLPSGVLSPQVMTDAVEIPGVRFFGIALGSEENVDAGRLNQLAENTGGYYCAVDQALSGTAFFDLLKRYIQIFIENGDMCTVNDPVYTINPNEVHEIEFDVLRGDVSFLVVLYVDSPGRVPPFHLVSPVGEVISFETIPPGYQVRSSRGEIAHFMEVRVPLGDPERYAKRWKTVISHKMFDKHPGPTTYAIAIGVGSNFRMQPFLTPGIVRVGDPILLSATVSEAGLPVTGCTVSVAVKSPSGTRWNATLRDDGAHNDGDPEDGEYAHEFKRTAEAGSYEFTFRARGLSRDGEPVMREAVRSKYVEGRMPVKADPARPPSREENWCAYLIRLLRPIVRLSVVAGLALLARRLRRIRA